MSVKLIFIRYFYTIVFTLLIPLLFLRLGWRSLRAPLYRKRILERFGFFTPPKEQGGLWLHAVSLGEVVAATPIIQQFQKQFPTMPITITTMTPTGSTQVLKTFKDQVFHVYLPYDLPWSVNRFLKKINPQILVMMETELWPNCLWICKNRQLPIIIANARLSPSSMKGYGRFKTLTQSMLDCVTQVAAQSKMDADRFLKLGLKSEQLSIPGNVKFDVVNSKDYSQEAAQLRINWGVSRPVWVAASTHKGEEEQVLEAFNLIRSSIPDALLILVPRHPERFQDVLGLVQQYQFKVVTRSSGQICGPEIEVFLGDTMGELALFYKASDVAYVGGSLVPIGGHNMLEPAMVGVPVVVGPYVHNFVDISQLLLESGALQKISNSQTLAECVIHWFNFSEERYAAGAKGKNVVEQNRGAVSKILEQIRNHLVALHAFA